MLNKNFVSSRQNVLCTAYVTARLAVTSLTNVETLKCGAVHIRHSIQLAMKNEYERKKEKPISMKINAIWKNMTQSDHCMRSFNDFRVNFFQRMIKVNDEIKFLS